MNLAVAVKAILTQQILVGRTARQTLAAVGLAGVEGRCMALLAQGRATRSQQGFVDRTMWPVTQGAIFSRRGVLPQERTSFIRVAAEAVVVERHLFKGRITQAAVGVVAVGATGFALRDGMPRGQVQLRAHLGMAVQAYILRLHIAQNEVFLLVGIVAAVASQVLLLVRAANPGGMFAGVVAGLATGTAYLWIRWPLGSEADIGGVRGGFFLVEGAHTVAGGTALAAASGERSVHGAGYRVDSVVFVVAIQALAFRPLGIGQHARNAKEEPAADEGEFAMVSGHFLSLLHLEVGFVATKAHGQWQGHPVSTARIDRPMESDTKSILPIRGKRLW